MLLVESRTKFDTPATGSAEPAVPADAGFSRVSRHVNWSDRVARQHLVDHRSRNRWVVLG